MQLKFWTRNQIQESELESESHDGGIEIRTTIFGQHRNRNWNRNHRFWKTLESESELESALVKLELESESLVLELFTTLVSIVGKCEAGLFTCGKVRQFQFCFEVLSAPSLCLITTEQPLFLESRYIVHPILWIKSDINSWLGIHFVLKIDLHRPLLLSALLRVHPKSIWYFSQVYLEIHASTWWD